MSEIPSSSVVELTTDVNSTVEHLKELGEQMKTGTHGFSEEDIRNIDEVIAALRELDAKRQKAHEILETETIKASVLRHKLTNFPHKLKAEVDAAVNSARESNAAQMRDMQSKLTSMSEKAEELEKKREVLELHNEVLRPEQNKLITKHIELVKKVNTCMARKTKMQIKLNETQESLRNTNAQIDSLEADMMRLQEDMKHEKEEFEKEKMSLTKQLEDTKAKCSDKSLDNNKLKRELDMLTDEVVHTGLSVSDKNKSIQQVELNIRRLLAVEEDLKKKLQTGAKRTLELENKCVETEKETEVMREDYATKKKEMLKKTQQFKREVEVASEETRRLSGIAKGLKRDLKQAHSGSVMQSRALKDSQDNVNASKRTLLFQAEEGARLESENKELHFRLAQLKENHLVNVQLLEDELSELKEKLNRESKTRQTVEDSYKDLQTQIETQRTDHSITISELTGRMNQARLQHSNMSERATVLEQQVKDQDKEISILKEKFKTAQSRLRIMRNSLSNKIKTLEENIADLTDELNDRNETIDELQPTCKSLEEDFEDKDAIYESKRTEVVALKSQRANLEERIAEIERQLEKIHIPQEKLRLDTLRCRTYTRHSLRQQCKEVEEMEEKVVQAHQQLSAIEIENKRIKQASENLEQETVRLRSLLDDREEIEIQLDAALKKYREELAQHWKENERMEEASSKRDKVVLKDISALKEASEDRLQSIATIHDKFEQDLQDFTEYVEIAAKQSN